MSKDDSSSNVAIACQGGGSHTAFTAGVLQRLFDEFPSDRNLVGISGTSGGAACATLAWYGLNHPNRTPRELLSGFWEDLGASSPLDRTVNTLVRWNVTLRRMGVPLPETSPAHSPVARWGQDELRRLLERYVDFEELPDLLDGTEPALLVSAIDVLTGEFELFRGNDLSVDEVLASAAEPHLFEAVPVDGHYYWDGLFSKNPPMKDFLTQSDIPDPDELWLVEINPQRRSEVPTTREEIDGRRNELSGNLSLNAEVGFLEAVNGWIEEGYLPDDFTHTDIKRIRFPRRRRLSWRTKLDRDPEFLDELMDDGERAARAFLEEL
ncbi:patatin-like phospholipase family protein [Halobium salinum]|uniref:Patatin-like phospholipase family protein n=1 Tax=Halobium salinum TaxID=1364940 RepID=A0ABD5PD60_9EURY|nr:patatin-like phospholipase family protein [Halobium salinum]